MDDVQSLIEELRYCGQEQDVIDCADCARRMIDNGVDVDCEGRLMRDAADALEAAEKRIAELEAQLPKEGEWIELDKIKTYCSNCNWASYSMLVQKDAFLLRNNKTKYCPNCGARMKTVTECHTLEEGER